MKGRLRKFAMRLRKNSNPHTVVDVVADVVPTVAAVPKETLHMDAEADPVALAAIDQQRHLSISESYY